MRYLLLTICLLGVQWLTAQEYTFSKLTQESIRKTKQPQASDRDDNMNKFVVL